MTVQEFKQGLEAFLVALEAHRKVWAASLNTFMPTTPVRNVDQIRDQSNQLNRMLGRLRKYIDKFLPNQAWIMHFPGTNTTWHALDMAISAGAVAQVKGSSIQTVVERFNLLLGRLDDLSPDLDLDSAPTKKVAAARDPVPPDTKTMAVAPPPTATASGRHRVAEDSEVTTPPELLSPTAVPATPLTLERVSLRDLLTAMGRLSLGSWLAIVGLLVTAVGLVAGAARWVDHHEITALRDSIQIQSERHAIDSLTRSADSLRALTKRGNGKGTVPRPSP
jgi:hypothetical protein